MQTVFKILWGMHPFENFVDFCSSLIVVLTCISLVYKPTRDRLVKAFTNKKTVENIESDKMELNARLDQLEAQLQRMEKKNNIQDMATITLLHDRLYNACEKALKNGKISLYTLDNITHLYTEYHRLGGNGTGTELFERVKNLPIIAETWEKE